MGSDEAPASARASDAAEAPGDGWLAPFELTVPARPHAAAAARTALGEWLGDNVPDRLLDDARLLVTELVTNCVRHGHLPADAPIWIRADLANGILRLEVRDPGERGTVAPRTPDLTIGAGYGLHLVDLLAARWGISRTRGTHVWLELAHDVA
jgi:anti-sigma regulatory factor (Ser/Thr protein kinase)